MRKITTKLSLECHNVMQVSHCLCYTNRNKHYVICTFHKFCKNVDLKSAPRWFKVQGGSRELWESSKFSLFFVVVQLP